MSGREAMTEASSDTPKNSPLLWAYENDEATPRSPPWMAPPADRPTTPTVTPSSVPTDTAAVEAKLRSASRVPRTMTRSVTSPPI
jgi:hypothetical protein